MFRPAYQGSNPVSDIWAVHALRIVAKYLKRYVTQKGQKRKGKTTFHPHINCGMPDPELSWASLFTKRSVKWTQKHQQVSGRVEGMRREPREDRGKMESSI